MNGIIRTFIAFYTMKTAKICTICISLETRVSALHFCRKQCRSISFIYRAVLFESEAVESSEVDAKKQISALKWRVEVIQGQSFYAHWKTDKLVNVAV